MSRHLRNGTREIPSHTHALRRREPTCAAPVQHAQQRNVVHNGSVTTL